MLGLHKGRSYKTFIAPSNTSQNNFFCYCALCKKLFMVEAETIWDFKRVFAFTYFQFQNDAQVHSHKIIIA